MTKKDDELPIPPADPNEDVKEAQRSGVQSQEQSEEGSELQNHAEDSSDESADEEPTPAANAEQKGSVKAPKKKRLLIGIGAAIVVVVGLVLANAAGLFHQHAWIDATCTEAKTCSECGATEGEPLGHEYVEKDEAATCTVPGKRVYTCSRCGDSYSEATGESAKGHTPGDWTIDTGKSKKVQRCLSCGGVVATEDVTREDLELPFSKLPVTLDSIYIKGSGSEYKYLYPDQIGVDLTNHSDKVARTIDVYACAYDADGNPVSVDLRFNRGTDVVDLSCDDANIAPGGSWSSRKINYGWDLDGDYAGKTAQIRGCVESVTYSDGTTWKNPYISLWESLYVSKKL